MREIVILGAGGHAKVVIDLAEMLGQYKIIGVVDNSDRALPGETVLGYPVKPELKDFPKALFVVAVGNNKRRHDIFQSALAAGFEPVALIHPQAFVSKHADVGAGTVVCAGAVIETAAKISENVIVNTCASVDHDGFVGSHAHVAVGARMGGKARLNEGALLSMGANLLPGKTVGAWAVAGAGSVITRDVPSNTTVIGVPARPVAEKDLCEST